ncbi:sensor histidine kinase [Curtobacterium citreum]|uniref:sensor histidine kinase n=1 Tax=Curtobacterium citreum TaxID=2036 RepID=UPI0009F9AF56|nr:HAMP domain-containing sensor histidine kinase [Curtobacterium citreum]
MTRVWSIGARTALAFAAAAMALTVAALVFVNLASQWSIGGQVGLDGGATTVPWEPAPRPSVLPDPGSAGGDSVSIVAVVAQQQWQWSAVAVVGVGVLAGAVGWVVSRRMLRPVDRMRATADRISASTLHERIALGGPDDELRRLSRTIDRLLDRLETSFEGQRRFVAQAAHELRTPLAVQRAALQIGLPDDAGPQDIVTVRAELLEQNRRTELLVESLLVLAEADRGLDGVEALDLAALLDDVATQLGATADTAGIALRPTVDAVSVGTVVGEPTLVRQLLLNLVDNAVEYNVPGGTVWVRLTADGIVVENTGAPVDPETVTGLLEPFRRGGEQGSRRHSGLGLSIVAAVVHAHGWTLDVAAREGGGLRVRIRVSSV